MGGDQPWPQVPVGNKDHTDAAVVIIGAGISGTHTLRYCAKLQIELFC
jgi:cation diffusion facilitator CzcD-associated flavoprotein CzcO